MLVRQAETRIIGWIVLDDITKKPIDLTGAVAKIVAVPRSGGASVLLPLYGSLGVNGRVRHKLSGTLPIGKYGVTIHIDKDGEKTISPTKGSRELVVDPSPTEPA